MANSTVLSIDPNFLLLDTYSVSDENLIANQEVTSTFNPETDYIEYYIYGLNNSLLYPSLEDGTIPYSLYSLLDNDVYIDPSLDLQTIGFDQGGYNTLYNFYSNRLNSSLSTQYFISEISSDRTEIRLDSNDIDDTAIISSVNDFIAERQSDEFFPDFLLNFGSNRTVIANNIQLDGNTVLIKLYDPLPPQFGVKSTLWVVEEVANATAYNVTFEEQILEEEDTSIPLKGPNLNLDLKDQINNSTEAVSLSELDASPLTGSYQQLQSLFNEEGIQINVDYTEYSNFVNFSSVKSRIENFEYKLQLIESYQESAISGSNVSGTNAVLNSKTYYENLINDTITNFDGYEYFLYFSSGSKSWPKSNTEPPFQNLSTTDINAINWYNEQITSASLYDELNQDNLFYDIPEYLRNDSQNQQYIDFVEMVGQHFDNIWIYLKDISNKYNADNRIDAGISKDLVAQTLRDFSLKIYQNNFSSNDIYSSFLGLTPSGSLFPFPEMTGSLPTPSGFEYVDTFISSSTDAIPLDDVNKRIYKRLYHNLPYLFKSKGTISGIKTLLNTYGIPDTILRISEFGGKDKVNANDYDYWYNKFNYALETKGEGYISSSWESSFDFGRVYPSTLEFRFKNHGIPTEAIDYKQVLWTLDPSQSLDGFYGDPAYSESFYGADNITTGSTPAITIRYEGTGNAKGTFDGAIVDPYNEYTYVDFYPDISRPTITASVYVPTFDAGWWSLMVTRSVSASVENYTLFVKNSIYNGDTGTQLGFQESSSVTITGSNWEMDVDSYFGNKNIILDIAGEDYYRFSGSYQEIRYYNTQLSESVFNDYVMNPLSIESNKIPSGSLDTSPDTLMFRASLGSELYTGSMSIHPKVTGSWELKNSFVDKSSFYVVSSSYVTNRETYFFDSPAVGVKNRINDKIRPKDLDLPTYNAIRGVNIPDASTLSNQISIQQDKTRDDIYTNNVNLLEVTFSPQNELNDDIISQLGHFNIGDLIGDPRDKSTSAQSYPELDKLRQDYFLKYIHQNYDFNDYVRLIKFFDNSLFKMIKDFVPARTSLASGITIKQHILERQKYPEPQASWKDQQYSGSVKSFPLDYATGSLQVTSGGDGGAFENFNHLSNFTQSWSGSNITPSGSVPYIQSDAPEFINGEFSGSTLLVENGELNPDNPIKYGNITSIIYDVISKSTLQQIGVPFEEAAPGELRWDYSIDRGNLFCNRIYIHTRDKNNLDITEALINLQVGNTIEFRGKIQIDGLPSTNYTRDIKGVVSSVAQIYPDVYSISFTPEVNLNIPSGTTNSQVLSNKSITFTPLLLTPNITYSDYNAIIGNATDIRPGTLYQDIDYSSNVTTPVNFDALISGSATKANIPDSNYSTKRITQPRYDGSRSTSDDFNLNSNEGGLGALPNVEQDRAYFAYFNWVGGTSPLWGNGLIDRSALSIRYFIDNNSNVIEPTNDSKDVNLSIVRQTFTEREIGVLSFDDESGNTADFPTLTGEQVIFKSGKSITPIAYSQTQSISDTTPGGATSSLQFVQGDQNESSVPDFRLTAYSTTQDLTSAGSGDKIEFVTTQSIGSSATWTNNTTYSASASPSLTSPSSSLIFDVFLEAKAPSNAAGIFKFVKNNTTQLGPTFELDWANTQNQDVSFQITDTTATNTDFYEVQVSSFGAGPPDPGQSLDAELKNTSFFRVTQTPPPNIGPISSSISFWQKVSGASVPKIKPNSLMNVYAQKQQDLEGSGFPKIQFDFTVEVGDEFRFQGTETQTYKVIEIDNAPPNGDPLHIILDREVNLDNTDMNWFLLRRYLDTPGQIIIEADKPAGGTSPGFFMPLYATKGIEDNFDNIIQKLKTDQLI